MKKVQLIALILLAAVVCLQPAAFAKAVSGKVDSVDAVAKSVSITSVNPVTKAEEKVTVSVKPETVYTGAASLNEIKAGEEVVVEVIEDITPGVWNALNVTVVPAAAAQAQGLAGEAVNAMVGADTVQVKESK